MDIKEFQRQVYQVATEHGFWEPTLVPVPTQKAEKLCLMHSEISEALEGVRKPHPDKYCPEFSNEEIELADALIRILDYAQHFHIRLCEAAEAKNRFNESRPYKHGKTF